MPITPREKAAALAVEVLLGEAKGDDVRLLETTADRVTQRLGSSRLALAEAMSDEALALAFQRGFWSREAFEALARRWLLPGVARGVILPGRRKLEAALRGLGLEATEIEETLAEVTLQLYAARLGGYDAGRRFAPWLRTVAVNRGRLHRRRRSGVRRTAPLDSTPEPSDGENAQQRADDREDFQRRLAGLSPLERQAIELRSEFSPREIAGMLGLPVDRVYRLLENIRRRLRQGS